MNSAAPPAADPAIEHAWDEVRRLVRRIGLLRAAGRHAEALDLEIDELSRAFTAARAADPAGEDRSPAIQHEETERIAQASALAEILAPLLAEKLRQHLPPAVVGAAAALATPTESVRPPAPNAAAPSPTSSPPSIADFIDSMLAQRPSPTPDRSRT